MSAVSPSTKPGPDRPVAAPRAAARGGAAVAEAPPFGAGAADDRLLPALRRLGDGVAARLDEPELLRCGLEALLEALGASAGTIALDDAEEGEPTLVCIGRLPPSATTELGGRQPLAVGAPLALGERSLGRVSVSPSGSIDVFDDTHRAAIRGFAHSLALAVTAARAERFLARAEVRRRRSERLEAVGRTAASILHDLNNLLTVVVGQAELQASFLEGRRERRRAEEIGAAAWRATQLARNLLEFVRKHGNTPEPIDATATIEALKGVLSGLFSDGVELEFETPTQPCVVALPRGHLDQVLLNLCSNARDALEGAGRVAVRVGVVEDVRCGAAIEVSVSDDGPGIEPENLGRIVEPFFSTRHEQEGTGLGLATVEAIARAAGGRLDIDSELGVGTTARVILPLATG